MSYFSSLFINFQNHFLTNPPVPALKKNMSRQKLRSFDCSTSQISFSRTLSNREYYQLFYSFHLEIGMKKVPRAQYTHHLYLLDGTAI